MPGQLVKRIAMGSHFRSQSIHLSNGEFIVSYRIISYHRVKSNMSNDNVADPGQGWRNDSRGGGGGTKPWGPRGKGSPSVSKGPKPPIQLLQLLKNSQEK